MAQYYLDTLVSEIEVVVKPGNIEKAKAGVNARWDNKETGPCSGSTR